MRVLVLNDFFASWTGSEIVALEVAEHFGATASSFYAAEPVLSSLPEWRPLDEIDLRDFDFVWSQHHAILPLLNKLPEGSERPFIAMVRLSPYEPNEQHLPSMLDAYADVVVANSPETASTFGREAMVLHNAAPDPFHFTRKSSTLWRILIVSNRIPVELREAIAILAGKGLAVAVVGERDKPQRITAGDIAGAHAVVSIGKTVRYALASSTPVYLYDRFGGDGWLTADNYAENEAFNFSGRPRERRLPPEAIAREIMAGPEPWTPPQQPRLSGLLDAIRPEPRPFVRHPDLDGAAAMAMSIGGWVRVAYEAYASPPLDPRVTGDAGSAAWLAMCIRKKVFRLPSEIKEAIRSTR